jgi:regulatory Fis family protein
MNPWDLVDHLCALALSEPIHLSERVLRAALSFTTGTRGAIFERHQDRLRLAESRGVDQAVLDDVQKRWVERRQELLGGVPVVGSGIALCPIMAHAQMIGLLYVDTPHKGFGEPRDLRAIGQFARVAAHSLQGRRAELEGYLAATAPDTVARDQLVVMLDQNEWNIARVARLLGVTRPTIYGRMRRLGIERRRQLLGKR